MPEKETDGEEAGERVDELAEARRQWGQTFDAIRDPVLLLDSECRVIQANAATLRFLQKRLEEIVGKPCWKLIHGAEGPISECPLKKAKGTKTHEEVELYVTEKDIWIEHSLDPIRDERGDVIGAVGILRDVTDRKRVETLSEIQRDLAVGLSATTRLEDGLRLCLEGALKASGMDCGGIYLVDQSAGALELAIDKGLSPAFVESVSHYESGAANVRLVMAGKPVYAEYERLGMPLGQSDRREGLRAIAVLPMLNEGQVIGCLNVASHILAQVPTWSRSALETIAAQVGGAVARLRAEDNLRRSEERYRSLIENIPTVSWKSDEQGNTVFISPNVTQVYGYTPEQIYQSGDELWFGRIHPEDREKVEQTFQALFVEGKPFDIEYRIQRKDGNWVWLHDKAQRMDDEEGTLYACGAFLDVTDRKRAEEALRASEKRFRSLVETAPSVVLCLSPDGRILEFNPEAERIHGVARDDVLGENYFERFLPEATREFIQKDVKKVLAGEPTRDFEHVVVCADGSERILLWNVDRLLDAEGRPAGLIALGQDVTERTKSEQVLRESEEKFRNLAEQSPNMIFINSMGRIVYANERCEHVTGYSRDELYSADFDFLTLIAPEDRDLVKMSLAKHLSGGEVAPYEYALVTRGGERLDVIVTTKLIEYGQKKAILGIATDVTERKKAEGALRESEERYRNLFHYSNDAILMHDLDGNILDANPKAMSEFGYTRSEILSLRIHDLHPTEALPLSRSAFQTISEEGVVNFEVDFKRKNGDLFSAEVSSSLFEIGGREVIQGIVRDVTERKRAEEALREREATLKSIFRAGPVAIGLVSDRVLLRVNDRMCEMLGYTRKELVGRSARILYPSDEDYEYVGKEKYRQIREYGTGSVETRWRSRDGRIIDIILSSTPLDPADMSKGVTFTALDITARKRADAALRASEERYRNVYETTPLAFVLWGCDCKVTDWNKQAEMLFGWSRAEVLGRNFFEFLIPEGSRPKVEAVVGALLRGDLPSHSVNENLTKSGKTVVCEWNNSICYDDTGEPAEVMSLALDITDRTRVEQRLLEDRARLKSLASELTLAEERERRRVATELHDQISQSLVISKMKLESLGQARLAKQVKDELTEVCEMLSETIAATRTLTFDLSPPILYELGLAAAVAEWLEEQIEHKHGIKTHFEDDGRPKQLDDDIRVLLFRNVRELLINVVKHAHAHKVEVCIERVDNQIRVVVEDDGVGFDPDRAISVSSGTEQFGLFSIRQRLEELGGRLKIESSPGHGCKAVMTAPLKADQVAEDR